MIRNMIINYDQILLNKRKFTFRCSSAAGTESDEALPLDYLWLWQLNDAGQYVTWDPIIQRLDASVNTLKGLPNVLKAADSNFALALIQTPRQSSRKAIEGDLP